MPDSITNKTRREMLSALRATRAALFRRRRRSKDKQARRSNTHESSSSKFFDPDAADGAMGRLLSEEEACECECEQNSRHGDDHTNDDDDNYDDSEEEDVLDATRRGGDGPAVPASIMTYAPTPSATPMFLSYGVQPLAPPAVSTRRASMGGYYRPTYLSDSADTAGGGRTMNRRGTVPPIGTAAAPVKVGGYLSSTVDNLVASGDDPKTCAAGLDIDTSNHHAGHCQDQHHATAKTYTFLVDQPPSTIKDGRHQDNNEEERRKKFEAKRKAEATRNPRLL